MRPQLLLQCGRSEFENLDDVAEIAARNVFKTVIAQEFQEQKVLHIELMFLKKKRMKPWFGVEFLV